MTHEEYSNMTRFDREERVLLVSVDFTNLKRKVRGFDRAYHWLCSISGHFDYQIVDFDTREVLDSESI